MVRLDTGAGAVALRGRRRIAVWFVTLAVLSEAAYLSLLDVNAVNGLVPVLVFLGHLAVLFALYAVAVRLARDSGAQGRTVLLVIGIGAVLFRITLLPAGLPPTATWTERANGLGADVRGEAVTYERFQLYDDDVWRYLWDGHVAASGVNPYELAPTDVELDSLVEGTDVAPHWGDIRDNINYAETPTIYPPLSQLLFRASHAIAPGSVFVMKALVVALDLIAALYLALTLRALGRPEVLVIAYAWNPLVIKVFAGSGHVDALAVAVLAATAYYIVRGSRTAGGIAFGLAILAKLGPVILLPFVVRRIGWRRTALALAIVIVGYVPYLEIGAGVFAGFAAFAREWQFNAGPFSLLAAVASMVTSAPDTVARAASAGLLVALVAALAWRDDGSPTTVAGRFLPALGGLVVLGPAVMPWYLTWVLPFAGLADSKAWLLFSGLVCLAFFVMVDETERAWILWIEYGVFAAVLLVETAKRISRTAADGHGGRPAVLGGVPGRVTAQGGA